MFYKLVLIISLVIMTTLLSGCNTGYTETDSVAYILAVGVDKGGKTTYQIAIPTATGSSTGGSGKTKDKTSESISIVAPTMSNLRSLAKTTVSRSLDASHNKVYIIGEEAAREGLEDSLAPQIRFYEYRGSEFVIVVKGSAEDFIRQNKPTLETLPSKYYENLMSLSPGTGFFVRTNMHQFYYGMKNNGIAAYAPLAAINTHIEENAKAPSKVKDTIEYDEPGITPRTGGNPAELMGLAVFRGDKMVGTLNNKETRAFSIVQGLFKDAYLSIADPFDPKHAVNILCWLKEKPKITVDLQDGHEVIAIQVTIEGSITGNKMGVNYGLDENRSLLEESYSQDMQQDIEQMIKHTQEYGADIAGFGLYARKNFRTYQEYMDFDWVNAYANAEVHVKVNVVIRRTGLLYNTSPFIY